MKKLVKAVIITTILGILTKAISFLLKVYISRIIGATALGYYQISVSAFTLLVTLVTSGLPLVISRRIAKDKTHEAEIVGSGLIVCTLLSVICTLFVVLFPSFFTKIWGQNRSLFALYLLLPSVVFSAIYVPIRGSIWGNSRFFTLGIIELVEQIIRVIACVILFNITSSLAGESLTAISYSIACTVSTIIAVIIYFAKKGRVKFTLRQAMPLVKESSPLAVLRVGTSLVAMLISVIVPLMLVKSGLTNTQAVAEFGIVSGMILPLLTIPGTVIGSISVAILPEISSGSEFVIKRQINKAISYSIILSLFLFPIYFNLGSEVGIILYNNASAGEILKWSSFVMFPLGLSQILLSILNALGKERMTLVISVIGSVFMILPIVLLSNVLGIYSLVLGFGLMSVINCTLSLIIIRRHLSTEPIKMFVSMLAFCIPACLFAKNIYGICRCLNCGLLLSVGLSSTIAVSSIGILLLTFKLVDIKSFLPQKLKNKMFKTA